MAWDRVHPRLTTRSAWIDHTGGLPVIEGTLIRLEVDRLPGGHDPLPVWLWSSATGLSGEHIDLRWQAFLRRSDLEHAFRMKKQPLGWARPKLRTPQAADRWTWLIIAAHTQLRLARPLVAAGRARPLNFTITAGQAGDAPFETVMSRIRVPRAGPGTPQTRPLAVLTDCAYSSRADRHRGIRALLPQPSAQVSHRLRRGRLGGRPPGCDNEAYKQRNTSNGA